MIFIEAAFLWTTGDKSEVAYVKIKNIGGLLQLVR